MPGTGVAFTASADTVPVLSMGTTQEVRPLTSSPSSPGQSLGGARGEQPTPLETVKPVQRTLVTLYSTCI
jgi:hypothetical protein